MAALAGCVAADEPSPTAEPPAASASASARPTLSPTPSPSPTSSPTPPAAGTYLALGDSLAVGVGATRPDETGYVALLFSALSQPDSALTVGALRNMAVSGETSTSMIRTGQLAAAIEAIHSAESPITLVTLDIGGNDLLALLRTDPCSAAPQGPDCLALLALTLDDFEANLEQIMHELTDALVTQAPGARLAVMTYFNPFSGTDASYAAAGELALLGADARLDCEADDRESRGMNDIIACVAEEFGATPVDVHPSFAGLGLELTHIGAQDIHANDLGYEIIADAYLRALRS
jgi:acyl-CoA thioesterase I